jgi:hypothetical protein
MKNNEHVLEVDVEERTWAKLTVRVDDALLSEYGCKDAAEFGEKVQSGDIDLWELDPMFQTPFNSEVEEVYYDTLTVRPAWTTEDANDG